MLSRGLASRPQWSSKTKERIRRLNQIQKKGLMRFHYWLNPLGLLLAAIHFSLSTCRSSSLPEWGLGGAVALVLIGSVIRFKLSPKSLRKAVYRIHTSPLSIGLVLIVLLIGHSIVD
jgi:membrane protein YdbS with pleckstrin-like domain